MAVDLRIYWRRGESPPAPGKGRSDDQAPPEPKKKSKRRTADADS